MSKRIYIFIKSDTLIKILNLIDGETGDYINDATVKIALFSSTALNPDAAAAENVDDSSIKIKITGHTLTTDDYIRIAGSLNYDGNYQITATETDYITIEVTYVAETFTGSELIYIAVRKGDNWPISLTHEGDDDDGYYDGVLPKSLKGLIEYGTANSQVYYLFVTITRTTYQKTLLLICRAIYPPE